jgi:replicative DNA helicase
VAADFYAPAHQVIFDCFLALEKRKEPIDHITAAAELRARDELRRLPDGDEYFLQLAASVPTAENVGHYVRLVWEASAIRQAIHFLAEAASRAYGNPPPGQFMRETRDGWAGLIAKLAKSGKQPLKAVG